MKAYCSLLCTILGRAALMSVTTAQGEGGLENREAEERAETWSEMMTTSGSKGSLPGDKRRSRFLFCQHLRCSELGQGRAWRI